MRPFDPLRFARRLTDDGIARERMIAEAAYYRAEKRGFAPGNEASDWLDAEREVDERLYATFRARI